MYQCNKMLSYLLLPDIAYYYKTNLLNTKRNITEETKTCQVEESDTEELHPSSEQ